MNVHIRQLFLDKITTIVFMGSVFFLFAPSLLIIFTYRHLPPFIPLYNQLPWGDGRIAAKHLLFLPLLLAMFTSVTNVIFAGMLYKKMPLMARILLATTMLITFFTFLFIFRTMQLVL